MPPVVQGFTITGQVSTNAIGSQWLAVRDLDGHRFVLQVLAVPDTQEASRLAARQMVRYDQIESKHLVRRHHAVAMADGTLVLVLDEVGGGSLAQLLGARGQLTPGETVTTVAPLFRALADLDAAGIVHGDLAPGNVVFTDDGRPLISELGFCELVGKTAGSFGGTASGAFVAPELAAGTGPSPASDVYAMAALGWFCLTGAPPDSAVTSPSLGALPSHLPPGLVAVLMAGLATDPQARPSAGAAALGVFEAATAESVALVEPSDPAGEVTRRIRAAAVAASVPQKGWADRSFPTPVVFGVVALLVALAFGAGAAWLMNGTPPASRPVVARSTRLPRLPAAAAETTTPATAPVTVPKTRPPQVATQTVSRPPAELATASSTPRTDPAGLLQALVDARALAYLARNSVLLDVVYAPGARSAEVDRSNIATATKNGGTYLGLSFVVKDVTFLDGTAAAARIRATIVTPAYKTGQPDGRRIAHPREVLGPCVFSLSRTPDGWRVLALTTP